MEVLSKNQREQPRMSEEWGERQIGFAILKPDTFDKGLVEYILSAIETSGLKIVLQKFVVLDEGTIKQLYGDRILPEWSAELFRYLSSGQSVVLVVDGPSATERLMEIRNRIRDENGCDFLHNLIHASDTIEEAEAEAKLFFEI